jgi:hypothetical protein
MEYHKDRFEDFLDGFETKTDCCLPANRVGTCLFPSSWHMGIGLF